MLEYDRINISEGIDEIKSINLSRECNLCGFWYFCDRNFNYQRFYCNGCHDMPMKCISIHNLAVVYVSGYAYRINFTFVTLSETINLMKRSMIIDKRGVL